MLAYSNGMTFKFKVKYRWGRQNVVFSIKATCILETVSDTVKVIVYTTNRKSYTSFRSMPLLMTLKDI